MTIGKTEIQTFAKIKKDGVLALIKHNRAFVGDRDARQRFSMKSIEYHMELFKRGLLFFGGHVTDDHPDLQCVLVLSVATQDDAAQLLLKDPGVVAGCFIYEVCELTGVMGNEVKGLD